MNKNSEKKPQIYDNDEELMDGFTFWNQIKKYFYFVYLFVFFICLIVPIIFRVEWLLILVLELMTTPALLLIWMIKYVIIPHKSRLLQRIEEIQQEREFEYESFAKKINCSARSPGSIICSSLFLYAFILVIIFELIDPSSSEFVLIFGLIFIFYAIMLPGFFNRRKDRIWVDPYNQGYIIRKKYFLFLFGKKRYYNWSSMCITVLGEHVHLSFNKEYIAHFKPEDDDYLQIIPKAFKSLKDDNDLDKRIALKVLTMYNTKKTIRYYLTFSIIITLAIVEIYLLTITALG